MCLTLYHVNQGKPLKIRAAKGVLKIQSLESYRLDDLPSVGQLLGRRTWTDRSAVTFEGNKNESLHIPVDRDSRDSTYLI